MGAFLDPLLACPAIENQFRRHCKTSGQKGQILISMLLNEKHMYLTRKFLRISNESLVFVYHIFTSQKFQVK